VRDDDETPNPSEVTQDFCQQVLRRLIQSGEWLVQQKYMCVLSQRSSKERPLLLASGKGANLPIRQFAQFHRVQGFVNRHSISLSEWFPPAQCRVTPHLHEAANGRGKIPIDRRTLRQICHVRSVTSAPIVSTDLNSAGLTPNQTGDRFQNRSLACPVRSQ